MSKQTDLINIPDSITVSGSNVGIGTNSPVGKLSIKGTTASNENSHVTFENTQGSKVFAIGGGKSGITNNGFSIINITDNNAPLHIDNSGRVTKPNQPSFSAKGSTQQTISNNGSDVVIEYPTVEWNIGNSYNNSTYIFTAPVAGKYFFKAWFMLNGGATSWSYSFLRFVVNNTTSNSEYMHNPRASAYMTMQGSVILDLAVGDYVSVKTRNASGNSDFTIRNDFRGFQGHLIG